MKEKQERSQSVPLTLPASYSLFLRRIGSMDWTELGRQRYHQGSTAPAPAPTSAHSRQQITNVEDISGRTAVPPGVTHLGAKLQSRPTFAQFSRFAWLGSSALLGFTLILLAPSPCWQVCTAQLISCPTTISSHNHYFCSQVLSAWQLGLVIFLRSLGLLRLALVPCSATCYAPCDIH